MAPIHFLFCFGVLPLLLIRKDHHNCYGSPNGPVHKYSFDYEHSILGHSRSWIGCEGYLPGEHCLYYGWSCFISRIMIHCWLCFIHARKGCCWCSFCFIFWSLLQLNSLWTQLSTLFTHLLLQNVYFCSIHSQTHAHVHNDPCSSGVGINIPKHFIFFVQVCFG